jgi:preprotein translocase subunit YajC
VQVLLNSVGLLLAQEGGGAGGGAGQGGGLFSLLPMFAVIALMFYFLILRPQSKEQSKRQAMLAAVKKNDRVVTAGGIYGVVTNVHREADEVTLKVDEATNTKLRVTMGSIARILGDEPAPNSASSS